MIRPSDFLFGLLVLGLGSIIAIAAWPDRPVPQVSGLSLTGEAVASPPAGDWIPQLSQGIEQRVRRERVAAPVDDPLAGYELIGLVETGEAQWALIAGNGESHTLELGDGLNGYELVQILADRIVFAQDGDQVVLELRR